MSKPRPIHHPNREIRTTPDESEPAFSYEADPYIDNVMIDDDFHHRMTKGRQNTRGGGSSSTATGGGGADGGTSHARIGSSSSFWRTNDQLARERSENVLPRPPGTSLLGTVLLTQQSSAETLRSAPAALPTSASGLDREDSAMRRFDSLASRDSNSSSGIVIDSKDAAGNGVRDSKKKDIARQRDAERRRKRESGDYDVGHIVDNPSSSEMSPILPKMDEGTALGASDSSSGPPVLPNFAEMAYNNASLERGTSDQSTGSLLYGKTPNANNLLGKSSSLIFPTGVEVSHDADGENDSLKRRKVNLLLDQCESVRFPFKKKLMLNGLSLTAADIPLNYLCGTSLGNALHKLSLAGNRLGSVPARLVQSLPALKHLDLSQCELHQLPDKWHLPQLKRINLSHNRLREFPEEGMLEGLPELQELNMYGNKVAEIIIPHKPTYMSKLETLNLGYNDLAYLPDELDKLKGLRTLKVMNNLVDKVPMRVCEMDLKVIDVSSNPVLQPPIETCERGICSMKRYYQCLRQEEQSKKAAMDDGGQTSAQKPKRKESAFKRKAYGSFMNKLTVKPPIRQINDPPSPVIVKPAVENEPPTPPVVSSEPVLQSVPSGDFENSDNLLDHASKPLGEARARHRRLNSEQLPGAIPVDDVLPSPRKRTESYDQMGVAATRGRFDSYDAMVDMSAIENDVDFRDEQEITVNDTLKVIFVGMAMVGKTSMIKRLIEGKDAVVPTHDERTVGVDIYEWDPKKDKRFEHIDYRIDFQDKELHDVCGDVDVKFSVWDFAGQSVYHATHELFFSPRALYVLVWDMGATNRQTLKRKSSINDETGAFKLTYDSSDDEEEVQEDVMDDFAAEEEARRADRALERDIDEKVQFWVDCIQSSAPGAAIIPVASFADYFASEGGDAEAKRRCSMLKQRLLRHEERRIMGIKQRLKEFVDENRANDPAAIRLRKLLCSYTRPKLIFGGDDDNNVVRVSGTKYTGFEELTEKIVGIAAGREKGGWQYPIFRGHVGARIPRMRLQVREAVRTMRDRFKVVEWGYFINQLRDQDLTCVEDISDALHFLTNIGELSYFGGVMTATSQNSNQADGARHPSCEEAPRSSTGVASDDDDDDDDDDMEDPESAVLDMDDTSITAPSTADGTMSTIDDFMNAGLSQFVFLNPRWLVAAVACILRHDLDREIKETRRLALGGRDRMVARAPSFYDAHLNCPVITADDACLLWQGKRITKKAAERAQEYSNNMTVTPFEFLQLLLIRFGVFVPIDLSIEKAFLGGKEYAQIVDSINGREVSDTSASTAPSEIRVESVDEQAMRAKFFFLPSLLGPGEPTEAWTYKNTDSWKATLCHSILFPDGVPPGLMERLTASVLSSIYAVANRKEVLAQDYFGNDVATYEGRLSVKEILCWRTAFFIKLGTQVPSDDGTYKESMVEVFAHLADRESHLCVGSDYMSVGMRRLIVSGRGQVGDGGRKIWKGGYLLVLKCVRRVMDVYGGVEFEKQGFCPDCLSKKAVSEASAWELTVIRTAVMNGEATLRCQHGHRVDTRLVAGPVDALQRPRTESHPLPGNEHDPTVPVQDLLRAVVVVGLWDGKTRKVVRVGSGFVVDRKRGLIVTASHTLMNIWGDKSSPFGENYYGLRQGKVVIGVIPQTLDEDGASGKDMAVFRYFAKIVTKDPSIDQGECHIDACVLRITTRMERDVSGDGEGCGDQPERLLLNNPSAMKAERLQSLKVTDKCELEEQIRILGYNQGGEGLLGPGESLNRYVDFARGYVCMKFASGEETGSKVRDRFKPREEIVAICPTIGGHSGGPCVNQQGEVIGILSRADPAENQRCYISPTYEWRELVRQAKRML